MKNVAAVKQKKSVTGMQKFTLGLGDLGYSLVVNTFSSYILFFGSTVMGVPSGIMGLVIACGIVWDAFTDPVMGFISDNTRSRLFGRRHQYILIGIFGMVVCNVMLWSLPEDFTTGQMVAWLVCFIIGMRTFTTMFQTPVSALSLDISSDYNERSSIQIVKSVFTILGLLLPTLIMAVFQVDFYRDGVLVDGRFNPDAYRNFGYVSSACCVLFGIIMFISTYSHVPRLRALAEKEPAVKVNAKAVKKIFANLIGALKDNNFRAITIGYMVSMVSASILIAVGFNVFTFTFETTKIQMYAIMAGLFIMTIVGQPLWMYLSKKYDKKKALLIGQTISLIGCFMLLLMFLLRDFFIDLIHRNGIYVVFMMPPLMVAGLGTGVLYSLPVALIGDTVLIEKARTGEDKTATYTGFLTLGNKSGQAISSAVLGAMLEVVGFQEGSTTQTPEVCAGIGWIMCVGVILAVAGGLIIFSRCRMTRQQVQDAMDKINAMETGTVDASAEAAAALAVSAPVAEGEVE